MTHRVSLPPSSSALPFGALLRAQPVAAYATFAGATYASAQSPRDSAADSTLAARPPGEGQLSPRYRDLSLGLRAGTLGAGVEVGKLVANHLAVRAGYFRSPFGIQRTISNVRYDARVQLQGASLLADLFPFSRGTFHVTGGVVLNGPRVTATALPGSGGTITLNDRPYRVDSIGRMTGRLSVPAAAPYFGLGFGTPAHHSAVAFVTDVGVMLGAPRLTLDATGASANAALRGDLAAQQARTQRDIDRYGRVVPAVSAGLVVRF